MKTRLSIRERENIKSIIKNPQLSGGVSLGEVRAMLTLIDKLEYSGSERDKTILTYLTLTGEEVKKIYQVANNFRGWPVAKWMIEMKERLDNYHEKAKKKRRDIYSTHVAHYLDLYGCI